MRNITSIEISNSLFDGLDLDFSSLEIKELLINNSGNDCADFSFGNYIVNYIKFFNCGDKGISVGEMTEVSFNNVDISNSLIGLASKDSSIVNVKNAKFDNSNLCLMLTIKRMNLMAAE